MWKRYLRALAGVLIGLSFSACQANDPKIAEDYRSSYGPPVPLRPPTATIEPEATKRPLQTRAPAPPPDVPADSQWQALVDAGFVLVNRSTVSGDLTDGVRAYVLTDGTKDTIMSNRNGAVNLALAYVPGSCVLAFYHWNGTEDEMIGVLGKEESPFWCDLVNWDQPATGVFYRLGSEPNETARRALHLKGHWGDLNQNGIPELVVVYGECTNDCRQEYDRVSFYEASARGVADIAANVVGTFNLRDLLIATDPPAFSADNVTEYVADQDVWRTMIYRWGDGQFVDRSRDYPGYYEAKLQGLMQDLEQKYGTPIRPFMTVPFLTILDITNWSGLPPEKGLELFLEATSEVHWPGTDPDTACWLQLARGHAQADFVAGKPFEVYPMNTGAIGGEEERKWLANEVSTIAALGYDTSRCPQSK